MRGFSERYEVSSPACGVIEFFSTLGEAERVTSEWKDRSEITIYDRYSRRDGVDTRIWIGDHLVGCRRASVDRRVWEAVEAMREQYREVKA